MLCRNPFLKANESETLLTPFPCGQCFHCRVNQARIWQTRLLLESMTSTDSTFLTLTYDDDNIPWDFNLDKKHLTKFLKRYRKRMSPAKIRYYAVGEYGDETFRPHFHLAIFSDSKIERCYKSCEDMRKSGHCTQDCIARLAWGKGNISVTPTLGSENAAYITGYIKKKATKDRLINRVPEYASMSTGYTDPKTKEKISGGIGYEGIKRIAEKYRNIAGNHKSHVIRSVNFGRSSRPLGGYLTSKLCDQLGVSESTRKAEFVIYATKVFDEYAGNLPDDNKLPGKMLAEIHNRHESKRHSRETRAKLYSNRRKL